MRNAAKTALGDLMGTVGRTGDTPGSTEPIAAVQRDGPGLVSVCIPTYNRATSLRWAAESVLSQSYRAIELIISDNASTDETQHVCSVLERSDRRVRVIRNDSNVGPTCNFNRARAAATGDFVMWLGDDDRLRHDYIERCLHELISDPSLALASGRVTYEDSTGVTSVGSAVELDDGDPVRRVQSYYRQVKDNGTFYGLSPRWVSDATPPMSNRMGNDWFLLAAMAFQGGFRTADTEIFRSTGGASRSLKHVASSAGFSRLEGEFPQIAIAVSGAWDIVRSPVFSRLGAARFLVAARCGAIVLVRFMPGAIRKSGCLTATRLGNVRRSLISLRGGADG